MRVGRFDRSRRSARLNETSTGGSSWNPTACGWRCPPASRPCAISACDHHFGAAVGEASKYQCRPAEHIARSGSWCCLKDSRTTVLCRWRRFCCWGPALVRNLAKSGHSRASVTRPMNRLRWRPATTRVSMASGGRSHQTRDRGELAWIDDFVLSRREKKQWATRCCARSIVSPRA